jgi:glycosyltransferase involved in cell wall biosynthesis
MIVKNEASIIKRCLDSVKPYITSWAIVDTGSTDGTQEIVKECLRDLPGHLYESAWVNFAHNRNEALRHGERFRSWEPLGDFLLMIDADEELCVESGYEDFAEGLIWADCHEISVRLDGDAEYSFSRRAIVRAHRGWKYKGVVHEYLDCDAPRHCVWALPNVYIKSHRDGARAKDPEKYAKDAALLQAEYDKNPTDGRTVFYLAQSYKDCGNYDRAIKYFQIYSEMGGWDEQVWYSKFILGSLHEALGACEQTVTSILIDAWKYRPQRAETPRLLSDYYAKIGNLALAYFWARIAENTPRPNDRWSVNEGTYKDATRWRKATQDALEKHFSLRLGA